MRKIAITAFAIVFCGTAAWADEKPSDAEAKSIQAALGAWGCSGGEMEKESESTGVFEVDDAKCKDGQYDFKLDKNFKIISMSRD
jgi:hypothetical protein